VKNGRKVISTTEKLDVIRRLEKGKRIVDKCLNVILAFISLRMIRDTAGIIEKVVSQEIEYLFITLE
jgi:hypothetical protein